jgi:hypothetical protein
MELYKSPRKAKSVYSSDFVPHQSPYEPSSFPLDNFPGQRFCTWGIFELVDDVDEEMLAGLRADGWEPMNESTREQFYLLEQQLGQTLIVLEKYSHRYWARTSDIQFATDYPVLLTHQTADENPHDTPSPARRHGAYALIQDGATLRLYTVDQLGEEGLRLCEKIRNGMLIVPSKKILSQQKVHKLAELRRRRWKETHEAAQHLAKLYWNVYLDEINSRDDILQSRINASTPSDMTTLPMTNAFLGLVQSFRPSNQSSTWIRKHISGELQLMTPNGSLLRVIGKNDWEWTALDGYVNDMMGPEGLKHVLVLLDAYYRQTGGKNPEADARVSLRQLLLRLKKGKKADTQEERMKLMRTILYLARTHILSKEYADGAGTRPQSFAKQQELSLTPRHYSPLLVVEPAKPGRKGDIHVPDEIEYHLGKEFFEALFGDQQQCVVVPTAQVLGYHALRQQQELLLLYYLSDRLAFAGGRFYVPFPSLCSQSALQTEEMMRQSHDRMRNVKRVLYALERLETDRLVKRTAHELIDTVLLVELQTGNCTRDDLAPATYVRIQDELPHPQHSTSDELFSKRRVAIQRLLGEQGQTHAVLFSSGPLLLKQSPLQKIARAQQM